MNGAKLCRLMFRPLKAASAASRRSLYDHPSNTEWCIINVNVDGELSSTGRERANCTKGDPKPIIGGETSLPSSTSCQGSSTSLLVTTWSICNIGVWMILVRRIGFESVTLCQTCFKHVKSIVGDTLKLNWAWNEPGLFNVHTKHASCRGVHG